MAGATGGKPLRVNLFYPRATHECSTGLAWLPQHARGKLLSEALAPRIRSGWASRVRPTVLDVGSHVVCLDQHVLVQNK